jgi:Skp family chaperone for outer membrane proteins
MKIRTNWILGIGLLLMIGANVFLYKQLPKQGYVNYEVLFQGFKGKQELEGQLNNLKQKHQGILDSLRITINTMQIRTDPIGIDSLRKKQALYQTLLEDFGQIQTEEASQLTNKIWLQINQYMRDYGQEASYDYIFGLGEMGSGIAYGKASSDITKEVLVYINKRYEGQ